MPPNQDPGTPLVGQLLEDWCHNACQDDRDWYIPEERYHSCISYAARQEQVRERPRGRMPVAVVIIEGDVGEGKSALACYTAAWYGARTGGESYHSGCFGFGRVLTPTEWFVAMNNVRKGSSLFIDESSNASRKGRDNADVQGILNQQGTVVRKQESLGIFASAMAEEMGSVLRRRADQIWRPQKRQMVLTPEARERFKRRGRGRGGRGKNNPGNFAYNRLSVTDRPYGRASMFDRVLGKDRDPKQGMPVYSKPLSIKWMRKIMPLLDTFQKVPIAAAMGVNRQDVIDMALGKTPSGQAGEEMRNARMVGWLAMAFNDGSLTAPEDVLVGGNREPQYMTAGNILASTQCELGLAKFTKVLREYLGLKNSGRKGYDLLEVYEAVDAALDELGPLLDEMMDEDVSGSD